MSVHLNDKGARCHQRIIYLKSGIISLYCAGVTYCAPTLHYYYDTRSL